MYFLFVDESGSPPKPEKAAGNYMVLAGLAVPEGAWGLLSANFARIKARYRVRGEIKWKYFGTGNTKDSNNLRHLERHQIDALRTDIFNLITSQRSVKIISCVVSSEAAYALHSVTSQDNIYYLAYKGLTERFQYFLQDMGKITGNKQLGIVVCDHRMSRDDQNLRERHHQLIEENMANTSSYKNFVETIFFAPSHASVGIQLADMVAGAIHRAFQHRETRHADALTSAFRASSSGVIDGYGLVKMPKSTFVGPDRREPPGGRA